MWEGWYFLSGVAVLIAVGMYLLISNFRDFNREEKAYQERQAARMAIIKQGIQEAERDGVEIVEIDSRKE